jgi:hypothetical protein
MSVGIRYRPWLTESFVVSAGFGGLSPGPAMRALYEDRPGGSGTDFLYGALFVLTATY